jgi:hypothetical protein
MSFVAILETNQWWLCELGDARIIGKKSHLKLMRF